MQVLVTGATGRTGSIVLTKLRQPPTEFTSLGFARSPEKAEELFGSTEGFIFGDIRDRSSLDGAMQGCQAVTLLFSTTMLLID